MGAQEDIDTRALEVASGVKEVLSMVVADVRDHKNDCLEERRRASDARQEFRDEVSRKLQDMTDDSETKHVENRRDIKAIRQLLFAFVCAGFSVTLSVAGVFIWQFVVIRGVP